jgi:uncharacterized protein (TIGR02145 family)
MKQKNAKLLAIFLFCIGLTGSIAQTITDSRDGNVYHIVAIGHQVWMAENLKYLPSVVGPAPGSDTTPYYYVYGYDGTVVSDAKATANYTSYGVLYNWPAAMNGAAASIHNPSLVQGVCPTGLHLPSEAEWSQLLIDYLGGTSDVSGILKETGTTHWHSPNTGATNETGFTALPGGYRISNGTFNLIGFRGYWWSTSEWGALNAWWRGMNYASDDVDWSWDLKEWGFSVRCVRDNNTSIPNSILSEELILYPNPATDKLYFKNGNYANSTIMIFNLHGKEVISKQIGSDPIDISSLEKGIYVMKFVCAENVMITKLVKE